MTDSHSSPHVDLRTIADNLPALIAYFDADETIRYANATYARWHGLSRTEIIGRKISDVLGPQRYSIAAPYLRRALSGESVTWETTFRNAGDGERKVQVQYVPEKEGDKIHGVYALIEDVTELIHKAEQHYLTQSAIASSLNAIAMACLEGRLTYVNDAFLKLWQLSHHDEAVGRHATDFWEDSKDAQAVVDALAQQGQWQGELQALRSDGSTFRARLSAHLVKNDKGEPISMMASFIDVTPEIASEQEVRRIAASLNEAQRLAKVGSWELDLTSNHLTWSDEIFRIFEIDQSRFGASYEAFLATVHPDDRETVHAAYTNSVKTRRPYTVEHRLLMADGRIKWVREQCETHYANDGTPLRSLGTVQDISERYAAQMELRRTSQLLDSIVRHIPNMVFVKRAENLRFALFNDAGEKLLGLKAQDLIGKNDYDLFPKEQADFFTAKDRAVLASNEVLDIPEEPIDTSARGRRLLHTRKIALRDDNGVPRYLLGVSEDITERRAAEDALRQLNETLEQRVRDRTAELDAAVEDAERANAAKSEFLSRMSHELRTPLNAILGFAQLLDTTDPPLTSRDRESVTEILQAGKHLLDLINEVLDFARIETGSIKLNLEPLDFCAIAQDSAALIAPLAKSRGIRIELPPPHDADWVLADATRLKQVLLNLLSNAAKYNREGGVITISCAPEGDEAIRMTIMDTGAGVAPENLPRLFEPFERLDAEKRMIDGTGIGLAISKGLVGLMNGTIGVDSTLGEGSRFWVSLPRTAPPGV